MTIQHAAVWLDHAEAKIFHVDSEGFDPEKVHPRDHVKWNLVAAQHQHPADVSHYFHAVADALADASEILVVGPGTAKLELFRYASEHARDLAKRIVGVETVNHPTDGQLKAYAHRYFHAVDRMRGTVP